MNWVRSVLGICLAAFAGACVALAGFFELTYAEHASNWRLSLDEVAKASRVRSDDRKTVERIVGGWVYVGPCKGQLNLLPRNSPDAIGFVLMANMSDPMGAATLGMIAVLGRENREGNRLQKYAGLRWSWRGPRDGATDARFTQPLAASPA